MYILEKQLFLGVIFAGCDFNMFLTSALLLKHENAPCTIEKSFDLCAQGARGCLISCETINSLL